MLAFFVALGGYIVTLNYIFIRKLYKEAQHAKVYANNMYRLGVNDGKHSAVKTYLKYYTSDTRPKNQPEYPTKPVNKQPYYRAGHY